MIYQQGPFTGLTINLTPNITAYLKFDARQICCDVHFIESYEALMGGATTKQQRQLLIEHFIGRTQESIEQEISNIERDQAYRTSNLDFTYMFTYKLKRFLEHASAGIMEQPLPVIDQTILLDILQGE